MFGEEPEGLHDGAERGEEDDGGKEKRNLPSPEGTVKVGGEVVREEGEGVIYGIIRREMFRRGGGKGEVPSSEGDEGGEDAVEAEEGEEVRCNDQEAACGGFGALLLVQSGAE